MKFIESFVLSRFRKAKKLVVSLKIQNVNGMCNQRNNERSGDLTRETYNQINWPDSSRFKFASINVFSDNFTCRRSVMNA